MILETFSSLTGSVSLMIPKQLKKNPLLSALQTWGYSYIS